MELIRKYPWLLLFGVLTAAFSSPGQTFLVSLFIPHMREEFGLSQTEIAGLYSFATLVSAFLLPLVGRLLDRMHLMSFTAAVGGLLALGCFVLSKGTGILSLLIGFLLIRNLGQGTLTMISSTTMARIFGHVRGKALGISNLGYPLGEAFFPILVSTAILAYGWRTGWFFLSLATALFFVPAVWILLRGSPHHKVQEEIAKQFPSQEPLPHVHTLRDWSVREMLGDRRFYGLLVPILIPPFFFHGTFFSSRELY